MVRSPIAALILFALPLAAAEPGWWMREPIRWLQTNLREPDAAVDPLRIVEEAQRFHANVLHINLGGIVAFYPTQAGFHYPSPQLPPGKDFYGDIVREAHARKIRIVARFDFSKTPKPVYDAHPEWFFRKADGQPVIYNGLYSTCINGGWYHGQALKILAEALERYDLDGAFFNMFGNQSTDYSGNFVGHCRCDSCRSKFRAMFNRDLPNEPDDDYRRFMFLSSREVAAEFGRLIHEKRPAAGYFNYIEEHTDGIMSESNTAVARPLPLWPYTSSDNVDRARTSQPGKMSVNLNMQFVDYAWRHATVPPVEIALRLWQNIAHSGAMAFAVNGTLDQQDRQAIEAARPAFAWAAANERYLAGQETAAKVLLLANGDTQNYRGLFRLLAEEHIPFAASNNLDWIGRRNFDLVITAGPASKALERYVRNGGRVLAVSARPPEFAAPQVTKTWPRVQGYLRIRDPKAFPSVQLTNILMLDGPFTETDAPTGPLTFVPPSMFGPPEKIHLDLKDTQTPALIWLQPGRVAWLPWEAGMLYYRHSLPANKGVVADTIRGLLPGKPQLLTDAHPLIEITVMRQGSRTLLHLVNLTGHSQTGYFPPLPTGPIHLDLEGDYTSARALRSPRGLLLTRKQGRTAIDLPRLADYELIALDPARPAR
jgi:hypothetical protein